MGYYSKLRISWILVGIASLVVSIYGVFKPGIYADVVSSEIEPGVFAQDILAVIAALVMVALSLTVERGEVKKEVAILGILGFFFYAYGLYVVEQVYTIVHPVYMAIFGASSFSIAFTIAEITGRESETVSLSGRLRFISLALLVITPLIFIPLWFTRLVQLIQTVDRIEYTFSVLILDLCFIMPGFVIVAYKSLKKDLSGILLAPSLFILGFFLLFPLALAELIKPVLYDQQIEMGPLGLYLIFSLAYAATTAVYLRQLKAG